LQYAVISALSLMFATFAGLGIWLASDRTGARVLPDGDNARLEWLVDPGAKLDLAKVTALPAENWALWDGKSYLEPKWGEAVWLRLTVRNPSDQPLRGVLQDTEAYTDRVDVWFAERGSDPRQWRHLVSGESTPVTARPWWALATAFEVAVAPRGETVVYLREVDYYWPRSWWQWWPRHEDYGWRNGARSW